MNEVEKKENFSVTAQIKKTQLSVTAGKICCYNSLIRRFSDRRKIILGILHKRLVNVHYRVIVLMI